MYIGNYKNALNSLDGNYKSSFIIRLNKLLKKIKRSIWI